MKIARSPRSVSKLGCLLVIVVLLVVTGCGGDKFSEIVFELNVEDQFLTDGPSTLKVKKNDLVSIVVSADANMSIHLHGYDLKQEIDNHHSGKFEFKADATGSFPLTIHLSGDHDDDKKEHDGHDSKENKHAHEAGEEIEIARLEVQPR